MITIIKHQITEGLLDAKFMFMAVLVLFAFVANGLIYSAHYENAMEDWRESIANTTRQLESRTENLQSISAYAQRMVKPPSALAFIADGGDDRIPNRILVNAFVLAAPQVQTRRNDMFALLPNIDWVFIIGSLMTLLTILMSFSSVSGEKHNGTLSLLLSYPVSRITLFIGKYIGQLIVLILILVVGILLNLTVLMFSNALPLTEQILVTIGWIFILSVLCLSFVLLTGIAVSSMVHQPAIALVVLMVFWLIGVIAVPGIARLTGENSVDVTTPFELERESDASFDNIWYNAPEGAGRWMSNLEYAKSDTARIRYETVRKVVEEDQKINDRVNDERVKQAELIRLLAFAAPNGLLDDALQQFCGTGIHGYRSFWDTTRRYQQLLHNFTVERDRLDPDSPHTVYAWWYSATQYTYSMKPVEFSTFPRWHVLWEKGGLYNDQEFPFIHFILFIAGNLQMAILAFIALTRYDPRQIH